MPQLGKSINLYLMDGNANGRWQSKLSNWNGVAYKIPRTMMKDSEEISDMHAPGVYFLFGKDDDSGRQFVYVGEADEVLKRLNQPHTFEKDGSYWTEAVVFVTPDGTLEKGRVKYLENRFHAIVSEAKRYIVKNGNTPPQSPIPKQIRDLLEEFIINARLMMPALGHRVFEPFTEKTNNKELHDDSILYFSRSNGKGGKATGQLTNDGFVVLKGSYIYPKVADYTSSGIKAAREKYASVIDKNGMLQDDVPFGSPSYASTFVCGKNSNGLIEWKNSEGISLKELDNENSKISQVSTAKLWLSDVGDEKLLHLSGNKVSARGQATSNGFVVFKGSGFNSANAPSSAEGIKKQRAQLIADGKVKDGMFMEDVTFKSPSTAAACIMGTNVNGRKLWKNAAGKSLKEIEDD